MELVVVIIFILGYLAITLEHNLKIDKLVPAVLMMGAAWATTLSYGVCALYIIYFFFFKKEYVKTNLELF
jgi:Na+-driven multidrug efflux pump